MKSLQLIIALTLALSQWVAYGDTLDAAFRSPPESTKPMCYWYWLQNDVTKEGITKDLEAMARVGINVAMIGNIFHEGRKDDLKEGPVKMFSSEWYALTHHAFKEAERLSIELMLFNGPGWSQSGGPWIKPEQSMRRVDWNEFPVRGGAFSRKVRPDDFDQNQDIAVLAVSRISTVTINMPCITNTIEFTHSSVFTARSLAFTPNEDNYQLTGSLYAEPPDGERVLIREINEKVTGRNAGTSFLPLAPETFSFKAARAKTFVLELVSVAGVGSVELSSEPKVEQVVEKQMGRMHPTPSPTWESYIFPDTVESDDPSMVVRQEDIINLTDKMDAGGVLTCSLPEGDWTIIYFGMVSTGKKNHPASPEATGLECDKMSRLHTEHHFNSMFGQLLKQMSAKEKAAFRGITIDSYEVGSQNWTDGFAAEFTRRNGYNPIALLPVMTGRVVDGARTSDQFLWDLRRTVADMIAENYIGGLRDMAHQHGLTLWCENYGHWGFPGEFLVYGGYSDEVGGEFWSTNEKLGTIECRAASSAGHIYGKRRVYAEAFTSVLDLGHHPYLIKARGEKLFCEGINHFVLHVYAHQPQDGVPGRNPWFGTAFHRNTPWFNEARDWVTYLQRCHYMLQQGEPVADVAVYIGDFAPQMTGPANPVPAGYDYDYIGSDAILRKLHVVDGEWVVYDEHNPKRVAARWKLLAMPKMKYIRPAVLKRLEALKKQGGKVVESVPVTGAALKKADINPIVNDTTSPIRWKARQLDDGMIFFLSNFKKTGTFEATLRVTGKVPELFNPVTGTITKLARYKIEKNGTRISIDVKTPADSCFIIFRDKPSQPSVVDVANVTGSTSPADLDLFYDQRNKLTAETGKPGTYTLTMSDGVKRKLVVEQDSLVFAIEGPWQVTGKDEKGYSILQETTFDLPPEFSKKQRVSLILGDVPVMAKVTLNGKAFDTLWMPPYTLDVSGVLRTGRNKLQILITSTSTIQPEPSKDVKIKSVPRITVNE